MLGGERDASSEDDGDAPGVLWLHRGGGGAAVRLLLRVQRADGVGGSHEVRGVRVHGAFDPDGQHGHSAAVCERSGRGSGEALRGGKRDGGRGRRGDAGDGRELRR